MLKTNQFTKIMLVMLGILFFADGILSASIISSTSKDEVQLPAQTLNYSKSLVYENIEPNKYAKNFIEKYPDWSVQLNKSTGSIHRAFGKPIKINSFDAINNDNIQAAAEKFINDNKKILGIDSENLYLKRANLIGGKWYVSFGQKYQGLDVLLSEIELRINQKGYVFAFGADYFNDITISTKPVLNLKQVESKAFPTTLNMKSGDKIQSDGQIFVLPVMSKGKVNYKLVYKFDESYKNPVGGYVTYIDANAGEIIWKQSTILNAKTKIIVEGEIKVNNPTETPSVNPLGQINMLIGGESYLADENGEVDVNLTTDKVITAKLSGPYCYVDIADQAMQDNNFIDTISPVEDFTMSWDDDNSHRYERNVFYYTNSVHDYVKSIDPDFVGMDYPMTVYLEFEASSPNAYWDGENITFISLSTPDTRMADGPAVLYHEYGHGINQKLYESQGVAEGMINASCNEGMADVNSSMILDIPEMGLGVFVNDPTEIIRTLDNKLIFPDSVDGESHHDGQILGGAYWDLRKLTSLETAGKIAHFAKYGVPDDANVGIAFSEWFLETLIADDDDGDISNKTPHFDQIVEAFNNHQIGTSLYMVSSFTHTPINDTQITDQPYAADFTMSGLPVQGYQPTGVKLLYSIDNFATVNSIDAVMSGNSNYQALIPAQPKGTIVQYYFEVTDPISGQTLQRYQDIMNKKPFVFIIGFKLNFSENFESETGKNWSIGKSDDDATTGIWELGKPNAIDYTPYGIDFIIQPGEDHSENGTKCLVTGAGGTIQNYNQYMPNGKTTFFSPVFDLSLIEKPLIRFYTWQFSYSYIGIPGYEPTFTVSASSDGGTTWSETFKMNVATEGWEKAQFLLEDYVERTSTNQLMVTVDVPHQGAQAFALYECLFDDFEILTISEAVSAEDNQISDSGISIYPNPFLESLRIQNGGALNISHLEISDLIGRTILHKKIDNSNSSVDIDGLDKLPSGTYFVKIYTDTGVLVRQVVK
jgi:Zn-dependent metalloprotease